MAKNLGMYIEGRKIKNFADIQRNFDYEIVFSNAHTIVDGWEAEDVSLRARTFTLPQRGNEPIESNYGAMKQFFPGKPTFGNTMQITFEETESQKVQNFLHAWQQKIFNINEGHANHSRKRGEAGTQLIGTSEANGICDLITINAYRFNGDLLDNKYYLVNAWLQNVDDVTIDFSQNESIKYNATFQFDFWTYGTTPPEFGAGTNFNFGNNSGIKE